MGGSLQRGRRGEGEGERGRRIPAEGERAGGGGMTLAGGGGALRRGEGGKGKGGGYNPCRGWSGWMGEFAHFSLCEDVHMQEQAASIVDLAVVRNLGAGRRTWILRKDSSSRRRSKETTGCVIGFKH